MKIRIPEDYSDITVRQYKKLIQAWDEEKDTKKVALKSISILCDVDEETVQRIDWSDIEGVIKDIGWLLAEPDPTKLNLPLQKTFTLNGTQYGFIPDWTKLSVGEFADLETYCSEGAYKNLESILAVVYRKVTKQVGKDYSIDDYSPHPQKNEAMLECPMDVAVSAMVFFYHIGRKLAQDTKRFLQAQMEAKPPRYTRNGGGTA
mgnify:CR=1 FL=1